MDDRERNIMNLKERDVCFSKYAEEQRHLMFGKGHDYTAGKSDHDANHNFRAIAQLLEGAPITPYTIALIYKLKHTFSLITFAKTGKQSSEEPIHGRHLDESNYTFILSQLTEEHLAWLQQESSSLEDIRIEVSSIEDANALVKAAEENVKQVFDATEKASKERLENHHKKMADLHSYSDHELRNELQARQLREDFTAAQQMTGGEVAGTVPGMATPKEHTDGEVAGILNRMSHPKKKKRIQPVS